MTEPTILLHACCGLCAEYPARTLLAEGEVLQGFFYNPNIHPRVEWIRRRDNLLKLAELLGFPVIVDPAYDEAPWQATDEPVPIRCRQCYQLRLEQAALVAAENEIPVFTTTLLVSPYQDHEMIRETGEKAAAKHGVKFLYRDFRLGFREGQNQARADGLYRQKYCGCIRSLEESDFKEKILRQQAEFAASSDGRQQS